MKIMEIEKAYTFNKMAGESFYLSNQTFYAILFNFFVLFVLTKFRDSTVYTYGRSTTNFLKEALATSVIVDVQKEGCEMLKIIFKL